MKNSRVAVLLISSFALFAFFAPTAQGKSTNGNVNYYFTETTSQSDSSESQSDSSTISSEPGSTTAVAAAESSGKQPERLFQTNDTLSGSLVAIGILLVVFAVYKIKKQI